MDTTFAGQPKTRTYTTSDLLYGVIPLYPGATWSCTKAPPTKMRDGKMLAGVECAHAATDVYTDVGARCTPDVDGSSDYGHFRIGSKDSAADITITCTMVRR